jgi:hypothetical protein
MSINHTEQFNSFNPGNTVAGNFDISCSQAQDAHGVCVLVEQFGAVTDLITTVDYDGAPLARVRMDTEATEAGAVYIYWAAGTWLAGTARTLRIARTGTNNLGAVVAMMKTTTPAAFAIALDTSATGTSASASNPSWTMNTAAATNTVCYEVIHSGLTSMTATPATGWNLLGSLDTGAQGRGFAQRNFTGGALTCGWTAGTADDFVGASVSFMEITAPVLGGARQPYVNRRAASRASNW